VVVAVVTGWDFEEAKKISSMAGFDLHLTKPIDLNEVKKMLAA
jgi:DNA-binding response OmpR family regulator